MKCPSCNGEKGRTFTAFVNRGEAGCSVEQHRCSQCGGSGEISEYEHGLYVEGRRLRDARVAADLGLYDAAKLFGCSTPELSAIEHGRAPAHHDILIQKIADYIRERSAGIKILKRGGPGSDEPHPFRR
jgi:hypothetical protein